MPGILVSRLCVVTGGSGGLGAAVVEHLLALGAEVLVPFPGTTLRGPLTALTSPRLSTRAEVDLADEGQVNRFYASTRGLWASIHLTGGFAAQALTDTTLEAFRAQARVNLETCFLCCREAVRAMRAAGQGGRLVNIAARPALEPVAGMLAYATAKSGVAALTRLVATETTAEGILCNALVPSIIDTPANRQAMPTADFSRWPRPSDLAQRIADLVAPGQTVTSGALIPVYGRV
jgi:NAD(P)-dependent dehydrogenase (short-subunit alcohol dehydrogenase family)